MTHNDYENRYGENKYMAPHKCGHSEPIYYHGKQDLRRRLIQAENSLCSKCKAKKLKKENERIFVPYWYYKKHLLHARNIVKGEYDKDSGKIELWVPKNKAAEYTAERLRRYYRPINSPVVCNRCTMKIMVIGNTEPISSQLEKLGGKKSTKYNAWFFFDFDLIIEFDRNHNGFIVPGCNPSYEYTVSELRKLDCIPDYSKIDWNKN